MIVSRRSSWNNSFLITEWINEDKIDSWLSVRWIQGVNYWFDKRTITNNNNFTVDVWFEPWAVMVKTISVSPSWLNFFSIWWCCKVDWILTTSCIYRNWGDMESLWTGNANSIAIMYYDPSLNPSTARKFFVWSFTKTWVSFNNVSLQWNQYSLEITVIA